MRKFIRSTILGVLALTLRHQVERNPGGSRLPTDLLVPAKRLLMQPIVR